jgi:signal transduction histidine kinase
MTWLRDRAVQILGVLCLLGQGTLLFLGSVGQRVPGLALPGLFLLLTLVLAVTLSLAARRKFLPRVRVKDPGAFLAAVVLVLAVGGLLAVCLGLLGLDSRDPADDASAARPENSRLLTEVRGTLAGLPSAMDRVLDQIRGSVTGSAADLSRGRLFRLVEESSTSWVKVFPEADTFPLEMIVWQNGQPVAWTAGAEPLIPVALSSAEIKASTRRFEEHQGNWYLRSVAGMTADLLVEMQISLPEQGSLQIWPRVRLQVEPLDQAPVMVDDRGDAVATVGVADSENRLALLPTLVPDDQSGRQARSRSRLMLAGGLAWLLAMAGVWRLFWGWPGFLVAMWLGRGVLAAVDYFRWTGLAFPGLEDPASPSHLISLVGPAYFATPFAAGWLASTADALLTAALISLTAWTLLRAMGVVGRSREEATEPGRILLGQGPVAGLVFGLGAAAVLLSLQWFSALVTENANPRLIGQGVSLTFLSFWGLHMVLMLISFSLAALLTGWASGRPWPRRQKLGAWLGGGAVAGLTVAVVFLLIGNNWRGMPFLAGALGTGFWLMAPGFCSRPRFLRRFAWPAVLLMTVVWNYAALRQVYDHAERNWLERKGQEITGSGEDWTRFLLEDALQGMRDLDSRTVAQDQPAGIWRDKAAFDLWRSSALGDLGYSCLVEIIDRQGQEESLFATGFMRDFQYEVVSRSQWVDRQGEPADLDWELIFQTERRGYAGGEEEILAAEIVRRDDLGWIRVELPTRSWRISTLLSDLAGGLAPQGGYQPRSEVDRPVLLLRGDQTGWLGSGDPGFQGPGVDRLVRELKEGSRQWAVISQGEHRWLCRWNGLPEGAARTPGEGFLLGLLQPGPVDNLLDLSRLMLLNLVLLFLLFMVVQVWYRVQGGWAVPVDETDDAERPRWLPGFQEKFLTGYLLLGLLLLLVVGMSVDKVGYDRVRAEARNQTREGLSLAVAQLRSLMVEQARSLAASEYIADLLVGQLAGQRTAGPLDLQQGMVYGADGTLLLDETLSNLSDEESDELLQAGRTNPLLVIQDDGEVFVATVIPIELGDVLAAAATDSLADEPGHGQTGTGGFFLYRQRFDQDLLRGLADLAQGQATLRLGGEPILASHPGPIFSGQAPLLASPPMMASLLDHPGGPGVFAQPGRPFAFVAGQPLPSFGRDFAGGLVRRAIPAVLTLGFPDREREYAGQRRETVLFLTGLANLILLTALLLALVMSWNLFRPLRVLLTATRSLARGDFDAPLPDAGGDEVGRLTEAFGRMRSELHSARDRLAARERFLTTVLDQVTVGVAVLDGQGLVVALNPAGRHILADFHPEVVDEEGARRLLAAFQDLGKGNPRWGGELRGTDGRHTLRGAMAPLELPDGRTDVMLVFEDITEFLHTKKMAINAELARQVAHEIKNPLTPIQLSVQLLNQAWQDKHPQLDKIVTDTVSRVLDQVELLRTIASEFSLLGRPGELELGSIDLAGMTNQVVGAYRTGTEAAENGLRVDVAEADLPAVLGEVDSLQKILGNLMQNSLDAARPDTPLEVSVDWEVSPEDVTLIWTDNGQGLLPEVADRLFDPYFSTKSKGTGLGLAICRNLADRMGGSVTLANRTDAAGARATLTLPRVLTRDSEDFQP